MTGRKRPNPWVPAVGQHVTVKAGVLIGHTGIVAKVAYVPDCGANVVTIRVGRVYEQIVTALENVRPRVPGDGKLPTPIKERLPSTERWTALDTAADLVSRRLHIQIVDALAAKGTNSYPTIRQIASELGCDSRTIRRHRDQAIADGELPNPNTGGSQ